MDVRAFVHVFLIFFYIDITVSTEERKNNEDNDSLLEICLRETKLPLDTKLEKLNAFKLGRVTQCMNGKYIKRGVYTEEDAFNRRVQDLRVQMINVARGVGVAEFSASRFELYEALWDTGGPVGADFVHDYIPQNLPNNTQADYKHHHKIWKTILDSSVHPGVQRFRNHLMKTRSIIKNGTKELDTELISRDISFAIVMIQNSKHGPETKRVGIALLTSAFHVREALAETHCIDDPDILDIVEKFEEVIRGTEGDSSN